ncbi:MAG: YtxH domain-containing protein [Oscillospiraceae bacterium]|jgi:gas vesicle protein|nr:YtxH domain-containing protein [Oscillospiraceae bacterium]
MSNNGFVKGIAVGAVAGAVIGVLTTPKSRDAKRTAAKFLRSAGEILEDVTALWH